MRLQKISILFLSSLAFVAFLVSCTTQSVEDLMPEPPAVDPCDTIPVSWSGEIVFIFQQTCAQNFNPNQANGCHQNGATFIGDFTTYSAVKARIDNSQIQDRALAEGAVGAMPPDISTGPSILSACDKKLIQRWIADGYPEN